jgi:hypothetical protein
MERALNARGSTYDPRVADGAFGCDSQVPARVNRTRGMGRDIHIDQLDRSIATGADRALRFGRYLVGATAFQAVNRLAGFVLPSR